MESTGKLAPLPQDTAQSTEIERRKVDRRQKPEYRIPNSDFVGSDMKSSETLIPVFNAQKPWHVSRFDFKAGKLIVLTTDSEGKTGQLEFNRDDVRLVQYISSADPKDTKRKLYVEVRPASRRLFYGQPSNRIIYLGEIDRKEFPVLKQELEEAHIDSVWYTTPRRETMTELLPKGWGPQGI